jgi:hypothetical protein
MTSNDYFSETIPASALAFYTNKVLYLAVLAEVVGPRQAEGRLNAICSRLAVGVASTNNESWHLRRNLLTQQTRRRGKVLDDFAHFPVPVSRLITLIVLGGTPFCSRPQPARVHLVPNSHTGST